MINTSSLLRPARFLGFSFCATFLLPKPLPVSEKTLKHGLHSSQLLSQGSLILSDGSHYHQAEEFEDDTGVSVKLEWCDPTFLSALRSFGGGSVARYGNHMAYCQQILLIKSVELIYSPTVIVRCSTSEYLFDGDLVRIT